MKVLGEKEILEHYPETKGIRLIRDGKRDHLVMELKEKAQVPYLTFPKLSACDKVDHLMGTRVGGVSEGQFASMNFSVLLGDAPERVLENYRRIACVLDCQLEDMVGTFQTHTTNIRRVTREDGGKGVIRTKDYRDIDGIVTNEKGLTLCAYTADCVPIFFADPKACAVGLAHSGWRGTVGNIAGKMVAFMGEEFGSLPENLIVGIGPSICRDCYEVDETVAEQFVKMLGDDEAERKIIEESGIYPMRGAFDKDVRKVVEPGKEPGKYQLDLWLANLILLCRAGVLPKNIDVTDLCTACNPKLLFSHRASKGKRGNMGAFIRLKN